MIQKPKGDLARKRQALLEAENERLRAAITLHHERCKTLGLNLNRDKPQWGGPWDHELWATVGLPSGPLATDSTEAKS